MTSCNCITPRQALARERDDAGVKRVSFFRPAVDVLEDATEFRIVADLPGASPQSVQIDLEPGSLTLTARAAERRREHAVPVIEEYGVGDFRRVFRISDGIDTSRAEADYNEGVLTIRLPKTEAARSRKIEVKVS